MNSRRIVTIGLLVWVVVGLAYYASRETAAKTPRGANAGVSVSPEQPNAEAAMSGAGRQVLVYYFHRTMRCDTCRAIETGSFHALSDTFEKELVSGALIWNAVNLDQPENGHFIQDFALSRNGIVLAVVKDDAVAEWENLDQVWELYTDEAALGRYVTEEVAARLERD